MIFIPSFFFLKGFKIENDPILRYLDLNADFMLLNEEIIRLKKGFLRHSPASGLMISGIIIHGDSFASCFRQWDPKNFVLRIRLLSSA